MIYKAIRSHEISVAHRLVNHSGKCQMIHGHNYLIEIEVERYSNNLDKMGMVVDFGEIKALLCAWLDENWDHHLILWDQDPLLTATHDDWSFADHLDCSAAGSLCRVPFNPTAENMANYLLMEIFPSIIGAANRKHRGVGTPSDSPEIEPAFILKQLLPIQVVAVTIEETAKCKVRVVKERK